MKWIKLLYTDINTIIVKYGHLTESFNVKQGVKQRCYLSSILFIICTE